jgi:ATP-binding cassette subfamily C (CFTR/MRP) protein 1
VLVEEEKVVIGKVTNATEKRVQYCLDSMVGLPIAIAYLLLFFVATGSMEIGSSFWLADWAEDSSNNRTVSYSVQSRLLFYGFFGIGRGISGYRIACFHIYILALFHGLSSFLLAIAAYSASNKLHEALVHNLMRLPMSFYDTTPLGRILNRVSKVKY